MDLATDLRHDGTLRASETLLSQIRRPVNAMLRMFLGHVKRDIAYGVRGLARTPGFALVAILTLGVGLGATTAVVGLIDVFLFRPPAGVADPSSLVAVYADHSATPEPEHIGVSYPQFKELQRRQRSLVGLAASIRTEGIVRKST